MRSNFRVFNSIRHHRYVVLHLGPAALSTPTLNYAHSFHTSASNQSLPPPKIEFPCLDRLDTKTKLIAQTLPSTTTSPTGPEPCYTTTKLTGFKTWTFTGPETFHLDLGGTLQEFTIAYETWGRLNKDRSNVILLGTGLSASSHAKSHNDNRDPGWWEEFIGPGLPLDTNKYFIICTNAIGSCYGSTGPSSVSPQGHVYATEFPLVTIWDQVRAIHLMLSRGLDIQSLAACVGASMGGMQMQAYAALYPETVGRLVSISACARAHPYSIAIRFVQRQILMSDPNYNRGDYYKGIPPHVGMKLARCLATITYRSGPEWDRRFGRQRISKDHSLCAEFLIEQYIDHQGEKFSLSYDANSLLYLSKAMDLFDMSVTSIRELNARKRSPFTIALPSQPEVANPESLSVEEGLILGMSQLTMPVLVLGVTSDILFPLPQQDEIAQILKSCGNSRVTYYVLDAEYGHDTFLIDKVGVGAAVAGHLA